MPSLLRLSLASLGLLGLLGGCSARAKQPVISLDGSSTVYPLSEAVAEEFQLRAPVRVTIGVSGTGGGFQRLCKGEALIAGASRPIKSTELEACAAAGIGVIELPVAFDGIAVVVHPDNDWARSMTVTELAALWAPEAQDQRTTWADLRAGWPDEEIHLYGPGVDSGTYDYFTKAIVGKEHSSRGDYTSSENDNMLVQGVSMDPHALGFFGYGYYLENQGVLGLVSIDDGDPSNGGGAIAPSVQTIADGTYQPLARPIFIYVSEPASARPDVAEFVRFYLDQAAPLAEEVGYVPLPERAYALARERFERRMLGTLYAAGYDEEASVEQLLAAASAERGVGQ